jgi:signal transduction histidine kinase
MMEERFGPVGSERYKDYLKDVHASGSHVLSLVNDLLDLSKIEAGKMELAFERVDVNAVISECVSMMQAQANQGRVIMRLSLAPRLPSVRADLRALRQILLNLLSNAVKFNEAGGQVIVSSAQIEGGAVVIRVKDTGVGMDEADIATALEPFARVESTRKTAGTGLGLPLTKALIEANHASFTIKSRKDEGTLVEVAFPPPQVMAAE